MFNRDWDKYGILLQKNPLSLISGGGLATTGVIGAIAAAIPGVNVVEFIAIGIGASSLLLGLIAAVRSIPPEFRKSIDLVGAFDRLENLDDIRPPLFKMGIIGVQKAGKSSLLNALCQISEDKRKEGMNSIDTKELYVYIHSFFIPPKSKRSEDNFKVLGLLDGPGDEDYSFLQNDIASNADFICIVLDHNKYGGKIDKGRIKEQDKFLNNMYNFLRTKETNLSGIHFLLNKRDVWDKEKEKDRHVLTDWFEDKVSKWRKYAQFVKPNCITKSYHSNEITGDSNEVVNQIKKILGE